MPQDRDGEGQLHIHVAAKGLPCRVFIVEDEALVLMSLEDMLIDLGFQVVARETTVQGALRRASDGTFDVAILDVNLAGKRIDPVAMKLKGRGIPFILASGYGRSDTSQFFKGCTFVQKPYSSPQLKDALDEALRL